MYIFLVFFCFFSIQVSCFNPIVVPPRAGRGAFVLLQHIDFPVTPFCEMMMGSSSAQYDSSF
jgi:hypothetical protein